MDGLIPILKPAGMTSHDVVARVRRILSTKRVGHTGTLDPAVTGVLPICVGKGTRVVEYVQEMPKTYEAELTLGIATDTEDQTGTVIEEQPVPQLSEQIVRAAFDKFVGEIEQVPPMYSAVKVEGKRLYQLAREGKEVERKPRKATIYQMHIHSMNLELTHPTVQFEVKCSKGTYIRSLCVDIGKALGFPAHMSKLVRTATGPFTLNDAITLAQLEEAVTSGHLDKYLCPVDYGIQHLPPVYVLPGQESGVLNGKTLRFNEFHISQDCMNAEQLCRVLTTDHQLLAISRMNPEKQMIHPVKVFS